MSQFAYREQNVTTKFVKLRNVFHGEHLVPKYDEAHAEIFAISFVAAPAARTVPREFPCIAPRARSNDTQYSDVFVTRGTGPTPTGSELALSFDQPHAPMGPTQLSN